MKNLQKLLNVYSLIILAVIASFIFILLLFNPLKIHKDTVIEQAIENNEIVKESKITIPYLVGSTHIKEYVFKVNLTKGLFSSNVIHIIHDDCLKYVKVNGQEVSLAKFDNDKLCEVYNGIKLNIGKYLKNGDNSLEIKIDDIGGQYGLNVKNTKSNFKFILLLSLLLIVVFFILLILFYYMSKSVDKSIEEKIGIIGKNHWIVITIFVVLIIIISFFTFFNQYYKPSAVFWDENYHIASSEKYVQGVYFMECHPPLGKLFIALGEIIVNPNKGVDKSNFVKTDYIRGFPNGYSFAGVRLFSTLFSMFLPLLLFFIFYFIFKNPFYSFIFSALCMFDNALIVHTRAAMLEGMQLFFIFGTVLYFIYLIQEKDGKYAILDYFILGLLAGFSISVKMNSAIILLLFIFLAFTEYWKYLVNKQITLKRIGFFSLRVLVSIGGILLIFFSVWYIHFITGKKIADNKYYKASTEYRTILRKGSQANPLNFITMFRDNWKFMSIHHAGVPRLNPCKPGENGSYPLGWPIGNKSINYRWAKNEEGVRYLYLQGNPIVWLIGFISVLLSIALIVSTLIFRLKISDKKIFTLIVFFTITYVSYMIAILRLGRVMYLYHYFIPLIISFILSYLIFVYLYNQFFQKHNFKVIIVLLIVFVIIFITFLWFSPLTYYWPLTTDQFNLRVWVKWWKMTPIK